MAGKFHIVKERWTQEITLLIPDVGQDINACPSTWPGEVTAVAHYLEEKTEDKSHTYVRTVDLSVEPDFWDKNVRDEQFPVMRD